MNNNAVLLLSLRNFSPLLSVHEIFSFSLSLMDINLRYEDGISCEVDAQNENQA